MEWTREKTLALISEYRKRRGLWDMTHDDYRKKEIKSKLLQEVSATLGEGIPIVEIEKKFHTLRTQYHRELNRIKRKEPYNSKWFGFNNLQFLSSPKACRSNNKGRVKEITEEGTLTTKYILREAPLETNADRSPNSSNPTSEEFITIQRKPTTSSAAYEASSAANHSHELEKLIEETTKDVDIEETKPKVIESTSYANVTNSHAEANDQQLHAVEGLESKMTDEQMDTIEIQQSVIRGGVNDESELNYQANNVNHELSNPIHHYIKIQRRDTDGATEYYEEHQPPSPQIQSIVSANGKRIYYDSIGPQHTATTTPTPISSTILSTTAPPSKIHHTTIKHISPLRSSTLANSGILNKQTEQHQQQQQQPQQVAFLRDELSTYGEYVANEMRSITNREILIELKHKINTALFEASMAELQK